MHNLAPVKEILTKEPNEAILVLYDYEWKLA
jgi:hypothetical protein